MRIKSVDQKFPWDPGSPPRWWSSSAHSSAWAQPYLPTLSAEKRGILQQNKPLFQHTRTDFFFWEPSRLLTELFYPLGGSEMQTDYKRDSASLSSLESNESDVIWSSCYRPSLGGYYSLLCKMCLCFCCLNYHENYIQQKYLNSSFNWAAHCKHTGEDSSLIETFTAEFKLVFW